MVYFPRKEVIIILSTKLILLDGIMGSGKSTTAQFLGRQLSANGIANAWHHEEEPGHPLQSRFDVENLQADEVEEFIRETPTLWKQFADQVMSDDCVHVIESILLQDTVRVLFQNNVNPERIAQLMVVLLEILAPLNPVLIYLWQADVEDSVRRIWARRGERWKTWCVGTDANTPYSLTIAGDDEARAIALWSDYQTIAQTIVDQITLPKLVIENSAGDWDRYRGQIMQFLGMRWYQNDTQLDLAGFCGSFRGQLGDRILSCTLTLDGDHLYCDSDFLWPHMRLIADGQDELTVESLPFMLHVVRDQHGSVSGLRIVGATRWNECQLQRVI